MGPEYLNALEAIAFDLEEIEVQRPAAPTIVNGRRVNDAAPTSFTILAAVQPLGTSEDSSPGGLSKLIGGIQVWTPEELCQASVLNGTEADTVVWNGVRYEVEVVEDWRDKGGHLEAMCSRKDR